MEVTPHQKAGFYGYRFKVQTARFRQDVQETYLNDSYTLINAIL
jgi:hypothetical protein